MASAANSPAEITVRRCVSHCVSARLCDQLMSAGEWLRESASTRLWESRTAWILWMLPARKSGKGGENG
jgi:hypothetical protein